MKTFKDKDNKSSRFRGKGGSVPKPYKKKSFAGGDKAMFNATCSECAKNCEVPFKPAGGKPVYCRDCFSDIEDNGESRGARPDNARRAPRKSFGEKPSFRSEGRAEVSQDDTRKQLAEINMKLDRLLAALEHKAAPKRKK